MARKKIREYDSKRLLKEHLKRVAGIDLEIRSAQVTKSTDFTELANQEPWLSSTKLVVKPDMLFGKRGKSGLVALNLDLAEVVQFVKERIGQEVEMGGCKAPITTFIVEPFVPHDQEYYLSIVSERLGCTISFSECGGIEIEENWDKVKTVFLPSEKPMTSEACAPLIATLPLEVRGKIGNFVKGVFAVFLDLDFTFLEMNPFALVNAEPYPLDMRGELDDTAAFKNFNKWGNIEFPLPFGRVLSSTESFIHGLDEKSKDRVPPPPFPFAASNRRKPAAAAAGSSRNRKRDQKKGKNHLFSVFSLLFLVVFCCCILPATTSSHQEFPEAARSRQQCLTHRNEKTKTAGLGLGEDDWEWSRGERLIPSRDARTPSVNHHGMSIGAEHYCQERPCDAMASTFGAYSV